MAMRVVFITGPRKGPSLIQPSVRSALERDPSLDPRDIIVLSDSVEPPDDLPKGVEVRTQSKKYLDDMPELMMRVTRNHIRATQIASEGTGYGCICADDVEFAKDWYVESQALAAAAARITPRFAITLVHFYQRADFPAGVKVLQNRELMRWPHPATYYGGQGMVYPVATARQIAQHWLDSLTDLDGLDTKDRYSRYVDMGIKRTIGHLNVSLYAVHPCLMQHTDDMLGLLAREVPLKTNLFSVE